MSLSLFKTGSLFVDMGSYLHGSHFCVFRFKFGKSAFLTVALISIIWLGSTASL